MKLVSPCDLKDAIAQDNPAQVLDVREPIEHSAEHVQGCILMPLSQWSDEKVLGALDKSKATFVLCKSGNRARQAAQKLEASGFADVRVIEGGLGAWCQKGYATVKGAAAQVWSLERQVRFAAGLFVLVGIMLSYVLNPTFLALSVFVGAGLVFSAVTDTCGMALVLSKMPWNQVR